MLNTFPCVQIRSVFGRLVVASLLAPGFFPKGHLDECLVRVLCGGRVEKKQDKGGMAE